MAIIKRMYHGHDEVRLSKEPLTCFKPKNMYRTFHKTLRRNPQKLQENTQKQFLFFLRHKKT